MLVLVMAAVLLAVTVSSAKAASTSDKSIMAADNGSDNKTNSSDNNSSNIVNVADLKTSGSTEPQDTEGAKGLTVTAIPDKPSIKAGDSETIHIKAISNNGTGIAGLPVQALIQDYATAKQKVVLGGKTDDKGMLDLTATIGKDAKTSQFVTIVTAAKDGQKSNISTGFTVDEKSSPGSGGSPGKMIDSKGRCSGSSCH